MTDARGLTRNGYTKLRDAVAKLIAGNHRHGAGVHNPPTPENYIQAEYLIDAGAIDIPKVLPGVFNL